MMRRSYDFFSFFVIPVLTLGLAAGYGLTETNFSVIASREGRRALFLLWGVVVANYSYLYVKEMIEFAQCRDRLVDVCLFLSFVLFLCGIGLPYLPGKVPLLSRLHVWAAFAGPACLLVCLCRLIWLVERKREVRLGRQKFFLGGTAVVSALLYLKVGMVSSLLELFVTLSACVSLADLQTRLERLGCAADI